MPVLVSKEYLAEKLKALINMELSEIDTKLHETVFIKITIFSGKESRNGKRRSKYRGRRKVNNRRI